MLGPDNRALLVDALRPPAGHSLDIAVGTTFSLDLEATLIPPVAFALFDLDLGEEGTPSDPISLLEAVRRHADRITIFCQAGQIGSPAYQPILAYLEESIYPVAPPRPHRIFHPKLWVLRFVSPEDEASRYRLLCLTRNLTFTHSWDTILRLEGTLSVPSARTEPLANFVAALPALAAGGLDEGRAKAVAQLADELRSVDFEAPHGFDEIEFWPLGLAERQNPLPVGLTGQRTLVVSPFLTVARIGRLGATGAANVLVSRPESLDAVGADALDGFDDVLALSRNAAEDTDQPDMAVEEAVAERAGADLAGLHAKLYVVEDGAHARVFTGSANATTAGFDGNVEFLIELRGSRANCGVDAMLGASGENTSLRDLLERYEPPAPDPQEPTVLEAATLDLERTARELAATAFAAEVVSAGDDLFALRLTTVDPLSHPAIPMGLRCWPISLKPAVSAQPVEFGSAVEAQFPSLSLPAITSFFAFELTASTADGDATWTFVVNARLTGAPDDRRERVLSSQLKSMGDVIRYLLFLLADIGTDPAVLATPPRHSESTADSPAFLPRLPLLESMVRALALNPSSLDHVARLIDDLSRTDEGRALLPPGLAEIWQPIWEARQEIAT